MVKGPKEETFNNVFDDWVANFGHDIIQPESILKKRSYEEMSFPKLPDEIIADEKTQKLILQLQQEDLREEEAMLEKRRKNEQEA